MALCALVGPQCACRVDRRRCTRLQEAARNVIYQQTSYDYTNALRAWREYYPYTTVVTMTLERLVPLALGIQKPTMLDSHIMSILLLDPLECEVFSINHGVEGEPTDWQQNIREEEQLGVGVEFAGRAVHFKPICENEAIH